MRCALALLLTVLPALAEESFTPRFEDGDVWVETTRASLDLKLKVTPIEDGAEGTPKEQEASMKREERRETTVIEGGKGAPAAWKSTWTSSRFDDGTGAKATELEGRTVEIHGRDATPADAPEAAKAAARETGAWRALLPSGPKNLDDTWTVPAAALARIVIRGAREEPAEASELKVTLSKIDEVDGGRIATLSVEGTIAVESRQEFKVSYEVKGTLRWDLGGGHPLSLELKGEAKAFEGKVKDEHGDVVGKIAGEGSTFSLRVDDVVK